VNPGPGLWSSTLHNFLKPRSHILVEPNSHVFAPHLKTLLDQKDLCKLVPEDGLSWETYDKILDGKLLPHQTILKEGDPAQNKPNDTLLFVANLVGSEPAITGRTSRMLLNQLTTMVIRRSLFQSYGLVRMLIWSEDYDKTHYVPRVVSRRNKLTILADTAFDMATEVAGMDEKDENRRRLVRDRAINVDSALRVEAIVRSQSIRKPDNRKSAEELEFSPENIQLAENERLQKYEELSRLEEAFARNEFDRFTDPSYDTWKGKKDWRDSQGVREVGRPTNESLLKPPETPEYERLSALRKFKTTRERRTSFEKFAYKQIDAAEKDQEALLADPSPTNQEDIKAAASIRRQEAEERDARAYTHHMILADENNAFYRNVPLLHWDRRAYNPLIVQADEFYPSQPLALLDLQPAIQKESNALFSIYSFMVGNLLMSPKDDIASALLQLAPGAPEALIPMVPELTDVENGGRADPGTLRVRMLTPEMMWGLARAWERWPFRPSMGEMMRSTGRPLLLFEEEKG
jgi:mitochondrial transcription factor 1